MADINLQRDPTDLTLSASVSAHTSATAGGTGDNTAVTGLTIDRTAYGLAASAVFNIVWEAALAQTQTLTLKTLKVEDSADGSTWATYLTITDPGVVATGPTGGGTLRGVTRVNAYLGSARRYIRFDWTPDLSASGTDTLLAMAHATFSGFSHLPPP
jgi:hypothetical protein